MRKISRLKKWAALGLAVMFAVTAAGCGSGSTGGNAGSGGSGGDDKVVINFFHRWPNDPKFTMFNEIVAQYEEENPDVTINMDSILNDQYKEKIRMVVSTDEIPDVFCSWSGSFAKEMIDSGNVMSLNEIIAADKEWSDKIIESQFGGFTFDGEIYGIPWSMDGKVFFYNKDIFAEHNLEAPATWDELIEVLDTLQAAGMETPITSGLADPWDVLHYVGTINQRMVDPEVLAKDYDAATGEFTDPGYVKGMEYWQQLTSYMGPNASGIDHETARNTYFANGESAIMYLQFAEIKMVDDAVDFDYGYFNFPSFSDGKGDPDGLTGAPEGFMISKNAKNPEACVEFLKWLISVDNGGKLTAETGEISCVEGAVNENTALPKTIEALDVIYSSSQSVPWFDNACDPAVYTVFGQGAQAIAVGDKTPEQVLEDVQAAAASLHK